MIKVKFDSCPTAGVYEYRIEISEDVQGMIEAREGRMFFGNDRADVLKSMIERGLEVTR